jgi:hypothetical protein
MRGVIIQENEDELRSSTSDYKKYVMNIMLKSEHGKGPVRTKVIIQDAVVSKISIGL